MTAAFGGLRVVDLTQGIAGPYATQCLGDFGADVIKVEPPTGDYSRQLGPPFIGTDSALFMMLNRNKRSVVIDYTEPPGAALLSSLIARADVFIEDLTPEQAQNLALTPEALTDANPRLVHCSLTPLGRTGPWANKPVTELEIQALVGQTHFLGEAGQPPVRLGIDASSISGGQVAYQAIVAALYHRERTGQGQHVDVSQMQALISASALILTAFDNPDVWEGFHCLARGEPPDYGFRTADEPFYFGQAYQSEQPWIDLCEFLGLPELATDPRFDTRSKRTPRIGELKPLLEEAFAKFPRSVLLEKVNALGNIAVPINDHQTLFEHRQVIENNRKITLTLAEGTSVDTVGFAWESTETPGEVRLPPPRLGEHTREILDELR